MSFYMVPTVLYQTQQKLKNAKQKKKKVNTHKKHHTNHHDENSISDLESPKSSSLNSNSYSNHKKDLTSKSPSEIPANHSTLSTPTLNSFPNPFSSSPSPNSVSGVHPSPPLSSHNQFQNNSTIDSLHFNYNNPSTSSKLKNNLMNEENLTISPPESSKSIYSFQINNPTNDQQPTPQSSHFNQGDLSPIMPDTHHAPSTNNSASLPGSISHQATDHDSPFISHSHNRSNSSLPSNIAAKFSEPRPNSLNSTSPWSHNLDSNPTPDFNDHKPHSPFGSFDSNSVSPQDDNQFRQNSFSSSVLSSHSSGSSSNVFRRNSSLGSFGPSSKQSSSSQSRFTRRLSSPFLHDKAKHHLPFHNSHGNRKSESPLHSPNLPGNTFSNANTVKETDDSKTIQGHTGSSGTLVFTNTDSPKSPFGMSSIKQDSYFSYKIPQFKPLIDLEGLNSPEKLQKNLLSPAFQIFRFNNFLDILSEHQTNDPTNFAKIRHHSLMKFIQRHVRTKYLKEQNYDFNQTEDIRSYEALLAYELLACRSFLRRLIHLESKASSKNSIVNCEELVQVNFVNYIRYILNLPNLEDLATKPDDLDDITKNHYRIKEIFNTIQAGLYHLKREDSGDEMTNSSTIVHLLLQSITKVSYEYILLEKYHIHIITKLKNNSLLESRITKKLFNLFHLHLTLKKYESIKVLNYNIHFSAQFLWFLSITIPFIRVFESNIYAEDEKLINNYDAYYNHQQNLPQLEITSFKESDAELFETFYKHLNFKNDYNYYRGLKSKHLVNLHRQIDDKSPRYAHTKIAEPLTTYSHKPINFEYYSKSLSTIELETFYAIHSADPVLQFTPLNYKIVLREFHRILKVGGVLELPIYKLALNDIRDISKLQNEAAKDFASQNTDEDKTINPSDYLDVDLLIKFNLIPKFTRTLLKELNVVFGTKNLKYTVLLLNSATEVNRYLVRHVALTMNEIFGQTDKFAEKYGLDDTKLEAISDGVHYYYYIKAEKTES